MSKIGIGGENVPAAPQGNRTNQDIYDGDDNAFGPAIITGFRGSFVVRGFDRFVRKRDQSGTKLFELSRGFDAGQQFLANESNDASAPLPNQLAQFGDNQPFRRTEVSRFASKRQRPNGRINQDVHERFDRRSRLWS